MPKAQKAFGEKSPTLIAQPPNRSSGAHGHGSPWVQSTSPHVLQASTCAYRNPTHGDTGLHLALLLNYPRRDFPITDTELPHSFYY